MIYHFVGEDSELRLLSSGERIEIRKRIRGSTIVSVSAEFWYVLVASGFNLFVSEEYAAHEACQNELL